MRSVQFEQKNAVLWICFFIALALQVALWISVRDVRISWGNVPPVPSTAAMKMQALGDTQMAYRMAALMLQNLGNTNGYTAKFEEYDYERLMGWFERAGALDARSDMLALLAAYYFSAAESPVQLRLVINYLAKAGDSGDGQKWRWLAQAVYLARFRLNDNELALSLARKLAALDNPAMPPWTRRMPAIILSDLGQEDAAYNMMREMLREGADTLPSSEVNVMLDYICTRFQNIPPHDKEVFCKGKLAPAQKRLK